MVRCRGRPLPVDGPKHQASPDRIVVNVCDGLDQLAAITHITVESAASLPEAGGSVRSPQFVQDRGIEFFPAGHNAHAHFRFQGTEQPGNWAAAGNDQEMHVFGHQHPGEKLEIVLLPALGEFAAEVVAKGC